ncbi:MAG: HEPN domain-containing protein [Planctomycetes bacterium]|nr:HEPN domain-containing protein [Planctomycetota bacterium]
MIDISKVVALWQTGAREDWDVAADLVERGRVRHGLFFAHLALEKSLKAHVCRHTGELAPHTHDLVRLAGAAGLPLDNRRRDVLARMNAHALAGRYPDALGATVTPDAARDRLAGAREVFEWLMTW